MVTLDRVIGVINTLAATGAALQASGQLAILGPKGMAIAVAVISLLNAVSHFWLPAPVASTPAEK